MGDDMRDDGMFQPIAVTPLGGAKLTGRTRTRIFGAIKAGELVARKDGKATLIEYAELQRWVRTFPLAARAEKAE